jgi:hypothetical protein
VVIDASDAGAHLPGIGAEGLQSLGHRFLPPFRRPHAGVDSRTLPRGAPALRSATRPSQQRRRHDGPRDARANTSVVLTGRLERKGIRVTFRASRRSTRRNVFRSGVASEDRRPNAGYPGTAPGSPYACGARRRRSSGGTSAACVGRTSSVGVFRFARGNEERILGNAMCVAQAFLRESGSACGENATPLARARRRRLRPACSTSSSFPRKRETRVVRAQNAGSPHPRG